MEGRNAARVMNELKADVVTVLQESDTMRHPTSIDLLVTMLGQELGSPVDFTRGEVLRPWLLQLANFCADFPDGMPCLLRCLQYVEQRTTSVNALGRLVDEWEAANFFEWADMHPLRPLLQEMRSSSEMAGLARQASSSRIQKLPPWCDTGWAVFLHLAGNNSATNEPPVSLAFLALAARRLMDEGKPEAAEHVRRWIRVLARMSKTEDLMAEWQVREPLSVVSDAYLMIQLEPDGVDPGAYYLSHWWQSDTEGWHPVPGETLHLRRAELPGEVENLIEQTEERWSDLRQSIVLEFILPWELLDEPVEWWQKESSSDSPTPLVMDYKVVLRSFERLRRAAWHRPWHHKWDQLNEKPAESKVHEGRPGDSQFHLERLLKADRSTVCLVLSEPPGGDSASSRQEFMAGLRAGIPAMIWHRGDCSDPAFREAVSEILQERALGGLEEWFERWRSAALAKGPEGWDNHVGRHLAILYDDPERRPGPPGPDHASVQQ
ncbi:hypothetical protein M2283_002125 [Streptomyces pseudovenezuelae]|uniref:TIR domain-containing protein n=2 Tax=Streptomyces pseudovenezuelae TaxID=67350 RepID=A0ABT6LEX1_9ACTN|nr:hypothetical protein [Streptomyces pseudovenezuelae]